MEKPQLIYQKNADPIRNKVIIPQKFINKYGRQFYMEVYEDKIILSPMKNKETQNNKN